MVLLFCKALKALHVQIDIILSKCFPQMNHGSPLSSARHVGDLGNIVSLDSTGITTVSITDSVISLQQGNAANIMGRAVVIHANSDNFAGASGNAGARQSCGVIENCDSNCQENLLGEKGYN